MIRMLVVETLCVFSFLRACFSLHGAPSIQFLNFNDCFVCRNCVATKEPPAELKGNYSEEHLLKTRAYSLDKKNFALVHGLYDTCETLVLLLFGGLPWLWCALITAT